MTLMIMITISAPISRYCRNKCIVPTSMRRLSFELNNGSDLVRPFVPDWGQHIGKAAPIRVKVQENKFIFFENVVNIFRIKLNCSTVGQVELGYGQQGENADKASSNHSPLWNNQFKNIRWQEWLMDCSTFLIASFFQARHVLFKVKSGWKIKS